jgi:hypothetical protein
MNSDDSIDSHQHFTRTNPALATWVALQPSQDDVVHFLPQVIGELLQVQVAAILRLTRAFATHPDTILTSPNHRQDNFFFGEHSML